MFFNNFIKVAYWSNLRQLTKHWRTLQNIMLSSVNSILKVLPNYIRPVNRVKHHSCSRNVNSTFVSRNVDNSPTFSTATQFSLYLNFLQIQLSS